MVELSFVPAWAGQVCSLGYVLTAEIERDLGVTLTQEQAVRLVEYYALDPFSGARLVRRAALRRPKGAGKSPEGAWCAFAELVLSTQFDGWDHGQPVGVPHPDPWVQLAAVSEDQTDNVMVWLFDTLAGRPDTVERHGLDVGRSRIYLHGRPGRLEPVTAAAGSREGQRITFSVLDQTESWTKENGGRRLADTLRRNAAKMSGWTLELQNAPLLGDGSVADLTAKAAEKTTAGVMFDTREPVNAAQLDLADAAGLRAALEYSYGESAAWVDLNRLVEEIQDPDTDPSDARRYYLNTAAPSSNWAFDRERWDDAATQEMVAPGSLVVAGFDGARHDDSTAIVCVDVESGVAWLHGIWERPAGVEDWTVPDLEVNQAMDDLFAQWHVWRVYCDPPYWETTVAGWEAKHVGTDEKPAVMHWWTNRWRPVGYACRAVGAAIRSGELRHVDLGDDDVLGRHVKAAVRRPVNARDEDGRPLWTLSKPAPGRKIDAAMALVLAWEARTDAIAAGAQIPQPKRRSGKAAFFY